jgi:galactokinase
VTGDQRPAWKGAVSTMPAPAQQAFAVYRQRFAAPGDTRPIAIAWAPGRVNLIGEHTDYNEGLVLPVAVDRMLALAGRSVQASITHCYSLHHDSAIGFAADRTTLLRGPMRRRMPLFARYVRAVLVELAALPGSVTTPAFDAAIAGDLPVGGGMSSSAALVVAAATFAAALGAPALPPLETAQLCRRAEQAGSGVRIGIMDQAASCLGRAGHALLLDCRTLAYEHVAVNLPGVALAVFDTAVPRALGLTAYNDRRRECETASALLSAAIRAREPDRIVRTLRDITPDDLASSGGRLQDVLLRRARHVVSENQRVRAAAAALRLGDAGHLGALLYASHASLRDDCEVSCPELDAVVEIARATPGVLGARMMGAGFGGSALILVRSAALERLGADLANEYPRRTGRTGALHVCRIAGGPRYAAVALDKS